MFSRSSPLRVAAFLAALLLPVLSGTASAQSALFSPVTMAADGGSNSNLVAMIVARPMTRSLDLARINLSALADESVGMTLRSGYTVATKQRTVVRSVDNYTWIGTFPEGGEAVFVVMNGEITGQIQNGTDSYSVQPVGNGVHAIIGIDFSRFPRDHSTIKAPVLLNSIDSVPAGSQSVGPSTADGVQVDVMVAYTIAAETAYGSNMNALAQLAVDLANVAYTPSFGSSYNANVSMRLLGAIRISYSESGKTDVQVLNDLVSGSDSQMVLVRKIRDEYGADLVGLIANISNYGCGRAAEIGATAANGFMVVDPSCAVDNKSFQHEFAHLFGALHDPFVETSNVPFAYGHGYIKPGSDGKTGWRTIMAYADGCTSIVDGVAKSCPRLNLFSNASLKYGGEFPGTAATHDVARVHRERVNIVAGFRTANSAPGTGSRSKDYDGDGTSDIAWRNVTGEAGIWFMSGKTITSARSLGVIPNNWSIVGQRDINGDGKSDLLWLNSTGDIGTWFMNGATVSSAPIAGNVGTAWLVVGSGDFDGDGKGDILWRNTSGELGIWLSNGTTYTPIGLGNVPTTWSVIGTADFNGDGKTDILWRSTSNDIGIWLMNGTTVTSAPVIGNVGPTWLVAGTGDFNGDGKGDILWRSTSNDIGIWAMNGASFTPVGLGNVGASWQVASVGDYNGDSKADILWRSSSNDIGIWFMNGAAVTSAPILGNVGPTWLVQNAASN